MFMAQVPSASPATPLRIRGRTLLALVIAPEAPLADWFAALDAHLREASLLLERPVVVDLTRAGLDRDGAGILLEGLEARGLRLAAVEGGGEVVLAGTRWEALTAGLPSVRGDRDLPDATKATPPVGLTIDRPVRSGQIIMYEEGDVTVIGGVASGAEVIAGGSIHVYGALRGRAIAGVRAGDAARIFCRRMEAELVGVGHLYRTAEDWGPSLHGRAVQAWCDRGALRIAALD